VSERPVRLDKKLDELFTSTWDLLALWRGLVHFSFLLPPVSLNIKMPGIAFPISLIYSFAIYKNGMLLKILTIRLEKKP
jgi:hypothetical protein